MGSLSALPTTLPVRLATDANAADANNRYVIGADYRGDLASGHGEEWDLPVHARQTGGAWRNDATGYSWD